MNLNKNLFFFIFLFTIFNSSVFADQDSPEKNRHMLSVNADYQGIFFFQNSEYRSANDTTTLEEDKTYFSASYAYTYTPMVQLAAALSYNNINQKITTHSSSPLLLLEYNTRSLSLEVGPIFNIILDDKNDITNTFYISMLLGYTQFFGGDSGVHGSSIALHLGKRFSITKNETFSITYAPNIWIKEARYSGTTYRSETVQGINVIAFDFFF